MGIIPQIILGSQSPRRKEILEFFTLPFTQVHSDFDEDQIVFHGDPKKYAMDVARGKAEALAKLYPQDIVLTADTIVYCDGKLFLKPKTMGEAHSMLRELSGKKHKVFTGVCIFTQNKEFIDVEESIVEFCELTDSEIDTYSKIFSPLDKAGGYAIQKSGSLIVKRIEGCYYNIMGLPLQKVRALLIKAGIDLWDYFRSA